MKPEMLKDHISGYKQRLKNNHIALGIPVDTFEKVVSVSKD